MAADLVFECLDVASERFAAGPTLNFRLKVSETTGERVHAVALRIQIRLEPQKRRYNPVEAERLNDLFGDPSRFADTLKPLQFAFANVMVPSFTGSTEVTVPVPCTYDLEVAATSYFHALDEGEIPLVLLFSGTLFTKGQTGFSVAQVPWSCEAPYRLPVSEWRLMMDQFLPGGGWVRLHRDTLDALGAFKRSRAVATWDQAVEALLDAVALLEAAAEPAGTDGHHD